MRKYVIHRDEEVIIIAKKVIEEDLVYLEAAELFDLSLSTVGFLLLRRLPKINPQMAEQVSKKVEVHRRNHKHKRGWRGCE